MAWTYLIDGDNEIQYSTVLYNTNTVLVQYSTGSTTVLYCTVVLL
jgi:hypothetical protein